ncbi:hypothetical protein FDI24_gp142 [Acidovorax phage ACP17]|uniref:Bacteriophage T4 Gp59 helicase assembly protein N-terminal domain-containing protein n=1 Tax=Acidovorax phage ACP17 TaxID=2010329 RepID=A0A218M307_9CAUD|nr:hypothetical protein FDI24_gp142 [Acidovorax phage ACP17]ASD50423.1 hypothetical protein [Acidovorax phage ACP17]
MRWNLNEPNEALRAFSDYVGLKLHFSGDLVWKPELKLRLTEESLGKRRDAIYFHRAAVKYKRRGDYVDLLVSSFFRNRDFWIGDLEHQENIAAHKTRMRSAGALLHTFKTDVDNIAEYMETNGVDIKGLLAGDGVPRIIRDQRKIFGGVTNETLATLDNFFDYCSRVKTNDPLWNDHATALSRYKYFCRPDKDSKPEFEKCVYKLLGT